MILVLLQKRELAAARRRAILQGFGFSTSRKHPAKLVAKTNDKLQQTMMELKEEKGLK